MRNVVFVASCVLSIAALATDGGSARAADLGDWRTDRSFKDEPIMVPRYRFSWTGFYLGGHVGYGWGDSESIGVAGGPFNGLASGFDVNPSGGMGGLQVGYNWEVNNLLFGLEGDVGFLGLDDRVSSGGAFAEAEYGGYGTLTARLGLTDDRWLFYLKGGAAIANIENRAGDIASATDLTDIDETRWGWTVGGGAEFAFHPNWSMKIEYLYMDFGRDNSTNVDGDTFRHDNDLHSIKVGLNYRFQPMAAPLR